MKYYLRTYGPQSRGLYLKDISWSANEELNDIKESKIKVETTDNESEAISRNSIEGILGVYLKNAQMFMSNGYLPSNTQISNDHGWNMVLAAAIARHTSIRCDIKDNSIFAEHIRECYVIGHEESNGVILFLDYHNTLGHIIDSRQFVSLEGALETAALLSQSSAILPLKVYSMNNLNDVHNVSGLSVIAGIMGGTDTEKVDYHCSVYKGRIRDLCAEVLADCHDSNINKLIATQNIARYTCVLEEAVQQLDRIMEQAEKELANEKSIK